MIERMRLSVWQEPYVSVKEPYVCVKEISPKLDQGIPEYNLGSLLMRVRGVLARGVLARGVSARYNVFSTECVLYRMCSLQNVFSRSSQRVFNVFCNKAHQGIPDIELGRLRQRQSEACWCPQCPPAEQILPNICMYSHTHTHTHTPHTHTHTHTTAGEVAHTRAHTHTHTDTNHTHTHAHAHLKRYL